jgi:hypothetical protein
MSSEVGSRFSGHFDGKFTELIFYIFAGSGGRSKQLCAAVQPNLGGI